MPGDMVDTLLKPKDFRDRHVSFYVRLPVRIAG
jgi:hypothetical protein